MKSIVRLIALVSAVAVCAAVTETEIAPGAKKFTLDNGIIAVDCVPDASGVIAGFRVVSENRQLIEPLNFSAPVDDLLPRQVSTARTGMRELAVGVKMENHLVYPGAVVRSKDPAVLELSSRSFYGREVSVRKTFTLQPGRSGVQVALDFAAWNESEKAFVLWFNGIARMGEKRDTVILPVAAGVVERNRRRLYSFPVFGIYNDDQLEPQQIFAAPSQPWIARVSPERTGVLVLVIRDKGEFVRSGIINTWKTPLTPLHTTELSFEPRNLKQGDKWQVHYDYIYFSGLKSLRTVAGNYGVDVQGDEVHISVWAPVPGGRMEINCGGKSFNFDLPPLKPGMVERRKLPFSPEKGFTGKLPGDTGFTVLPRISGSF